MRKKKGGKAVARVTSQGGSKKKEGEQAATIS